VRRLLPLLLAAACAPQAALSPAEREAANEAMIRAFPHEANLYRLAAIDDAGGRKLARFERPAPGPAGGKLARLQEAFCAPGPEAWRCTGPLPAVRVTMDGSTYTALAPAEMDDATVVALYSYVGSECFAREVQKLGLDWNRAAIRSLDRDGTVYQLQFVGKDGTRRLTVEPGSSCPFEIREISTLTEAPS
jgi:hypothetical protein